MDENILEQNYRERLEQRLIMYLAEQNNLPLENAMDVYYSSRLAEKIYRGVEGVQYLDYRVLAEILKETEPDLLRMEVQGL